MQVHPFEPVWRKSDNVSKITLAHLWRYLGWPPSSEHQRAGEPIRCPEWPPDLFALCAAALKKSGAYTVDIGKVIEHRKEKEVRDAAEAWSRGLGAAIRAANKRKLSLPEEVARRWRAVTDTNDPREPKNLDLPISRLIDRPQLVGDLITMMAIADETCGGIGVPVTQSLLTREGPLSDDQLDEHAFHDWADQMLFPTQFGSTLCRYIHPSIARVLPKMHTAQCGLTIRSFSHHLAYCETEEVQPSWLSIPGARGDVQNTHHLNILIMPWPYTVTPGQIRPSANLESSGEMSRFRSFSFAVTDSHSMIASKVSALADEAERVVGSLDALVMPELALSHEDYRATREVLLARGLLFIAGVGSGTPPLNYLAMDVPVSIHHAVHLRQRKHHRWKLDQGQIMQYGLGARLNPAYEYWEKIQVDDRKLLFMVLRPWLVTTALICEDLARHDPVGGLIRGIGPNLVIALLMDGPQLSGRWASRYAAGLADDPGCSVLCLTSVGMAELSRPLRGDRKTSRVIALWKDAFSGAPIELELPQGYDGLVITLAVKWSEEWTADLRSDGGKASYPQLAGVHPVKVPGEIRELPRRALKGAWISPYDASLLSRLAQEPKLSADIMPPELEELSETAFRIGREIWRLETAPNGNLPEDGANWATPEERETAKRIREWHHTNRRG